MIRATAQVGSTATLDGVAGMVSTTDAPAPSATFGTALTITDTGVSTPGNLHVHTRQIWDGQWSTLGNHILGMLQKARDSTCIMPGLDIARPSGLDIGGSGTTPFTGAVLMADQRIFMVPRDSTTARIIDLQSMTVSTPAPTFPGNGAFAHGVLLLDNRVFLCPFNASNPYIYNAVTDSLTSAAPALTGYFGCVLLPSGKVYLVPDTAAAAAVYDVSTDTATTIPGTGGAGSLFSGGVLLPTGFVLQVPYNASSALVVDPATGGVTTISGIGNRFSGGILLPDERVFLSPSQTTTARVVDVKTGTVTTPNGTYTSTFSYRGGSVLPDGRVMVTPVLNTSAPIRIWDSKSDTTSTVPGTVSRGYGGLLLPDGRVVIPPVSGAVTVVHTAGWGSYRLPNNVLTSPYLNKF